MKEQAKCYVCNKGVKAGKGLTIYNNKLYCSFCLKKLIKLKESKL